MVLLASARHQALPGANKPTGGLIAHQHQQQTAACCCCCCSDQPAADRRNSRASSMVALAKSHSNHISSNHTKQTLPPVERCRSKTGANKRRLFPQRPASSKKPAPIDCPAAADCAKCQLLVRWTSAQALLTSARVADAQLESSGKKPAATTDSNSHSQQQQQQQQPLYRARRKSPAADRKEPATCAQSGCNLQSARNFQPSRLQHHKQKSQVSRQVRKQLGKPPQPPPVTQPRHEDLDELEISSLTESSLNDDGQEKRHEDDWQDDKWSLSSCYEKTRARKVAAANGTKSAHQRMPSIRARVRVGGPLGRQKRRPAPLPPLVGRHLRKRQHHLLQMQLQQQQQQQQQLLYRRRCDNSTTTADSGNTSGTETSRLSASEQQLDASQLVNQQMAPSAPTDRKNSAPSAADNSIAVSATTTIAATTKVELTTTTTTTTAKTTTATTATANGVAARPNLLSETEVYSIEHFLRSHKSSIYVCGCMANLYLTSTRLVDNGRCSKPAADGWQLSQTGVPVLTFDSGLTRNRDRRRLSINLAERGSGFVLWSDIIDHLSNYRAFCTRLHGQTDQQQLQHSADGTSAGEQVCETFHVMYLSTNHRIMVGLSFDDATCARFFLKQVELVTSDPANIALTGPKLAHRIASVGRLGRLLTGGRQRRSLGPVECGESSAGGTNSDWSSGSELEPSHLKQVMQVSAPRVGRSPLTAAVDSAKEKARQSRLSRLIAASRRADGGATRTGNGHCTGAAGTGGSDYSWSTLKRAIRFGGQQSRAAAAAAAKATRLALERDDSATHLEPAFRPKPLAALAAAGRVYRPGKRMPRKCDISAPCLFQHVTSIDLGNLERLHSRALVSQVASAGSAAAGGDPPKSLSTSTAGSATTAGDCSAASDTSGTSSAAQQQSQQHPNSQLDRYRKLSLISQQVSTTSAATTSSGSSCYSSASISPANSECGVRHAAQVARAPRPRPPQVPRRSSSTELRGGQVGGLGAQSTMIPPPPQPPPIGASSSNKIQAIIRELQAQTSAELIDAKRKLMADIADQVVARGVAFAAAAASAASASTLATTNSSSGSLNGSQSSFCQSSCGHGGASTSTTTSSSSPVGCGAISRL